MEKNFLTTYRKVIDWLNPNLILCNDIAEVDPSVFENARFNWSNTKDAETGAVVDDDFEGRTYESQVEVMQWFLTSLSEFDVKFLEEHFGRHVFHLFRKVGLVRALRRFLGYFMGLRSCVHRPRICCERNR